jgi:excisionase family DNA binding protein
MEDFLDVKELSEYLKKLKVKQSTLYWWVEKGRLPHYKFGKMLRFRKGDIDVWVESNRKEVAVMEKKAIEIPKPIKGPKLYVDEIVRKTIAEARDKEYTLHHCGKPGLNRESEKGGR